jgi:HPt (histidine-containing phosphotransfer) domain-containing protein
VTDDPRGQALVFLLGEHLLSRTEAEAALVVAEKVLRAGLSRLAAAETAGDARDCQDAAHALKGSLLNLGLANLADLAQRIQDAARRGDPVGCRALVRKLACGLESFFGEA